MNTKKLTIADLKKLRGGQEATVEAGASEIGSHECEQYKSEGGKQDAHKVSDSSAGPVVIGNVGEPTP